MGGWKYDFIQGFSYIQIASENFSLPVGYKLVRLDMSTYQPSSIGLMPSIKYYNSNSNTIYCPYYCNMAQTTYISIEMEFEKN